MKVLFCLTSLGAGGTERSTVDWAIELRRHGLEAEVAVLKRTDVGFDADLADAGIPLYELAGSSRMAKVRSLRKLIGRVGPDVVHTAIFDADIVGRLAAWRTDTLVVSSLISTPYDPARLTDRRVGRLKLAAVRAIDGWTARHLVTAIHAVSEGTAEVNAAHLRLDRSRIHVVERGRDPTQFRPPTPDERMKARAGLGFGDDTPLVVAVGRLEFAKGHVRAVEALARLRCDAATANTTLLIAGRPGNASADLEAAIERFGVRSSVQLLGHSKSIAALLWAADVFMLPSVYEGTAGAVLEAMGAGVPIVASDLPGMRGVLEDRRNARVVGSGDIEGLASAVRELLNDDALRARLVTTARQDFEDRFTLERSGARLAALYRSLADTARVGSSP